MSVFTAVSPDEARAWLKNFVLGDLVELKGISDGIENTNYFLTTTHGRYVLTLFEKLTAQELPFFVGLMAHLSNHGVPCPRPVADLNDCMVGGINGKPAVIVSRLAGKPVSDPTLAQCTQVGEVLADLHLAGRTYMSPMANPRGTQWREQVAPEVRPYLSAERAALLDEEMRFQSRQSYMNLPQSVVHADLFRDNILFDGEMLGGVIDFYFACHDVQLYDVAIAVNDWCIETSGSLDEQRTVSLLQAYHVRRPFTLAERSAWPAMLRLAALRFWLSRLFDLHFPRPGELTHAKDPEHFGRILQSRASRHDQWQMLWP
ncbi:MAG: homoserine kinase [Thiobacillaceae bacterium]